MNTQNLITRLNKYLYIINVDLFTVYKKPEIGRWNTDISKYRVKKSMDFANYDNCFTSIKNVKR